MKKLLLISGILFFYTGILVSAYTQNAIPSGTWILDQVKINRIESSGEKVPVVYDENNEETNSPYIIKQLSLSKKQCEFQFEGQDMKIPYIVENNSLVLTIGPAPYVWKYKMVEGQLVLNGIFSQIDKNDPIRSVDYETEMWYNKK